MRRVIWAASPDLTNDERSFLVGKNLPLPKWNQDTATSVSARRQGAVCTTRDVFMRTHGYSASELSSFYAALDCAVREAAERNLEVSIPDMVRRLFQAAEDGERDRACLVEAMFRRAGRASAAA